jgi:hypothetical protein
MLARTLRLASLAICLIALASFVTFAVDQTSSASTHQQAVVGEAGSPGVATKTRASSSPAHKSALHETIDEAFSALSSPFSGITASSGSEWTNEVVDTLLVLFVYGFGLGFLARLLRVRL